VTLDTSLSLRDEGVSAFRGAHRQNPDVNGLAAFLAAVNGGRVPPGSFLLLENLDRLTREAIVPAVNLFTGLLLAGIQIVQLRPAEQVFTAGADMTAVMLALVELSRGHSESAIKSQRIAAVWNKKRKEAADKVLTRRLPAWIEFDGRKLVLNREKAAAVRRVYKMAREGMGVAAIAKALNVKGVPVIGRQGYKGRAVSWSQSVVLNILHSRAAIGEYQPHVGRGSERKPIGKPFTNYYPPVVSPDEWHATQAAIKGRATVGRGRQGKHVNLFAGLLRDARDGGSLYYFHQSDRNPILIPVQAKYGRHSNWCSFPAHLFEDAILSKLSEVKPRDVFVKDSVGNKVDALASRLAELDAVIATWTDKMGSLELVDVVGKKLAELGVQRKALATELQAARREAADPAAGAWGRFRSLAAVLKSDPSDETRTAVRNALRRVIEGVWCVFAGDRRNRLAAVRVQFNETDQHRDYLIACSPVRVNAKGKRERHSKVWSFAEAGAGPLDLRKPADVAKVERLLQSLKLDK
jgi:DNA invertase Pin-like site-specific DNA recombinase